MAQAFRKTKRNLQASCKAFSESLAAESKLSVQKEKFAEIESLYEKFNAAAKEYAKLIHPENENENNQFKDDVTMVEDLYNMSKSNVERISISIPSTQQIRRWTLLNLLMI